MDEEKKPTNFKDAALSHIPPGIVENMLKATKVDTDGMGFIEAIAKNGGGGPLPLPPKTGLPEKQYVTIAIDNTAIKVSTDPFEGAMTLFAYLLATVWSKDKKVAKVLKSFNFSFADANGKIIYPKQKKKK